MKVNEKTIYSSIEATEEEALFCKKILEIAEDISLKKGRDRKDCLIDILCDIAYFEKVDFEDEDWR